MRFLGFVAVLAVLLAVAAYATRPGLDEFDAMLKQAVQQKVAETDIGTEGDALATIAMVGCKLRPSDCVDLIRQSLDVVAEEHAFYTRFMVKAGKRATTCTGAFTRIWCDKGLLKD